MLGLLRTVRLLPSPFFYPLSLLFLPHFFSSFSPEVEQQAIHRAAGEVVRALARESQRQSEPIKDIKGAKKGEDDKVLSTTTSFSSFLPA